MILGLQGVAYWIGHRRCMYRNHHINEGAIIVELCNIMNAHLPKGMLIKCERRYPYTKHANTNARRQVADIVIYKRIKETKKIRPKYIIEVKRSKAGKKRIKDDLEKLTKSRSCNNNIRHFLFVFSENATTTDDFNEIWNDTSTNEHPLTLQPEVYMASPGLGPSADAHYSHAIEVW